MRPRVILARDEEEFVRLASEQIAQFVEEAVTRRGRCDMGLAGGRTPRPVYEALAEGEIAERIPWSRAELYFADERCVRPDDPASNYRMVSESLLAGGTVCPVRVHRIPGEKPDRRRVAAEYDFLFPARLDLLLLGMGDDGHTASLFPGSPALDEMSRRVIPVVGQREPVQRITITPRVIAEARAILVMIFGKPKASTVARVIRGPHNPKQLPIQLAFGGTWILDRAAAGKILRDLT